MARMKRRFKVETGLACLSLLLLAATLVWREWIEFVFRVDPDHGNGLLEWVIVGVCAAATVVFSTRAHAQWKRIHLQPERSAW
jgi:hypothetical protein